MNSLGGGFGIVGFLLLAFVVFTIYFVFKQAQFVIQAVNLYKTMVVRLDKIIELLSSNPTLVGGMALQRSPGGGTQEGNSQRSSPEMDEATKKRARAQRLAEAIRGNPKAPIDEKTAILQLLGGSFAWEKGSHCRAYYKGTEHEFATGQDFSDWFSKAVLPDALQPPLASA